MSENESCLPSSVQARTSGDKTAALLVGDSGRKRGDKNEKPSVWPRFACTFVFLCAALSADSVLVNDVARPFNCRTICNRPMPSCSSSGIDWRRLRDLLASRNGLKIVWRRVNAQDRQRARCCGDWLVVKQRLNVERCAGGSS